MKLIYDSAKVAKLGRLASQLADRFERIGLDFDGNMDPADEKLLNRIRKQIEDVEKSANRKAVK